MTEKKNVRDELAELLYDVSADEWRHHSANETANALLAAGYSKPRTITDHYAEEGGTDDLRSGAVILSHGEAMLVQSDGTFADVAGSTWDFWELELPITVLYEPGAGE